MTKLPYDRDRIQTPPVGVENWSENLLVWAHEPTNGLGLCTHFGRMGNDPEIWEGVSYILLPNGEVLCNRSIGRSRTRCAVPPDYLVSPVWPGQTWTFHFSGHAQRAQSAELSTRLILNQPYELLEYDLVFNGVHPIFDYHDDMQEQAWGTMHVEQGGTVRGSIRFSGESHDIDCTGYRDHSAGPRNYTTLRSEEWVLCTFPSGRVFAAYEVIEFGSDRHMQTGYLWEDGKVSKLELLEMPKLQDFAGTPRQFEVVVRADGRERRLTGRMSDRYFPLTLTLPTGIATGIDAASPQLPGVVEAPCVYSWDGEVGHGWIERIRRMDSLDPA